MEPLQRHEGETATTVKPPQEDSGAEATLQTVGSFLFGVPSSFAAECRHDFFHREPVEWTEDLGYLGSKNRRMADHLTS